MSIELTNQLEPRPELIVGLVGPIGSDLRQVFSSLEKSLADWNYHTIEIQPIELLCKGELNRWQNLPHDHEDQRYHAHMDAGNEFCKSLGRADALAILSISAIRQNRKKDSGDEDHPKGSTVFVLRSLKRAEEVRTLRAIYGSAFVLVAAYSPKEIRLNNLARRIAESHGSTKSQDYEPEAQKLVVRDEREGREKFSLSDKSEILFGQNVRETFPLADIFINTSNATNLHASMQRFVEILFDYSFHTPTRDEYCMFHAAGAAIRSSSESRQVGAVISTPEGDIIAVGSNEVPKAGGGQYWADDEPDQRDFRLAYDSSEHMKKSTLVEILNRLRTEGWLDSKKASAKGTDLIQEAIILMEGTQLMNLIEFGRAEHAEMAALLDAARRGISVKGCTLYTTTFPCHDCARHIVTSGINRVVYIEPYPKSLANELHVDAISVDTSVSRGGKLNFEPFVGAAPRRYMRMFTREKRKNWRNEGSKKHEASPRISGSPIIYLVKENDYLKILHDLLTEKGLLGKGK